ncbi:MAG: helix-turn-helix transcriptional regulator [Mycobacterium sp.]
MLRESKSRVLEVLQDSGTQLNVNDVAARLGLHPNTVRFHLDSLVSDGQVEHVELDRKGPGRPALMFCAVRQMDRGGTRHYRLLAEILAVAFAGERDASAKALAAGRAWGHKLDSSLEAVPTDPASADEAIDHLVNMLDELGFAPERRAADGEQQVGLRHCPFLELAENRTAVVCPVHLGLMQGAMEAWGAPVSVDRLDAFVEPDLCVAHLAPQSAAK